MVRFGILGPGEIAHKFAKDILLVPNAKLVAVASRSLEKANKFKEEFDLDIAYGSYEELASSDLIDAVYIATPHNFHLEQAKLMISHKKHVLVEKPITVNRMGLNELLLLAKKNNVLAMEAFWTRFLPSTNFVKELVVKKELGSLKHMSFNFGFEISEDYPENGRLLNPKLAGGSILDLGIYPVSTAMFFADSDIREVEVHASLSELGVDLDALMNITFHSGVTATLHSSLAQDLDANGHLIFENGEIIMKDFFHSQNVIVKKESIEIPYRGEGFVDEIESFSNTILAGKTENDVMTFDVMRNVISALDLIREKAEVFYEFEKGESID